MDRVFPRLHFLLDLFNITLISSRVDRKRKRDNSKSKSEREGERERMQFVFLS